MTCTSRVDAVTPSLKMVKWFGVRPHLLRMRVSSPLIHTRTRLPYFLL